MFYTLISGTMMAFLIIIFTVLVPITIMLIIGVGCIMLVISTCIAILSYILKLIGLPWLFNKLNERN